MQATAKQNPLAREDVVKIIENVLENLYNLHQSLYNKVHNDILKL